MYMLYVIRFKDPRAIEQFQDGELWNDPTPTLFENDFWVKESVGKLVVRNPDMRSLQIAELKHLLESQNIDIDKKSPDFIYGINSRSKSTNELLKRSISNAARNDINLKPGTLNNADGECLWESLNFNAQRACIKYKNKESARELKQRSITKAQKDTEMKKLPFMPENTTDGAPEGPQYLFIQTILGLGSHSRSNIFYTI